MRVWGGGLGKRKERTITKPKRMPPAADVLKLVETSLDDDKAENVIVIDLTGKTEIADYLKQGDTILNDNIASVLRGL